jgi:hypothetical protein
MSLSPRARHALAFAEEVQGSDMTVGRMRKKATATNVAGVIAIAESTSCELSGGCPFGPDRGS